MPASRVSRLVNYGGMDHHTLHFNPLYATIGTGPKTDTTATVLN